MLMMSTRKFMPESVEIEKRNFGALVRYIKRSVRDPHRVHVDIEAMTDQFDVYLNGTKIAVYMAGG